MKFSKFNLIIKEGNKRVLFNTLSGECFKISTGVEEIIDNNLPDQLNKELYDDFLKKGIMLIVDGTDQELVSIILETELECIEKRHNKKISFWDNLAAMGPAWGMIGTLIGLINMLKLLDDPSSIGPNMAVALITTMYGSLLANWISIPIATKLRANNRKEIAVKEIVCEGILSIQAGENPRVIEEKLKSFLAPADRNKLMDNGEQGGEA